MVVKHCCWGTCNSDSRQKHKEHMKDVTFVPFVKPHINKEKCERWIRLCYRKEDEFNIKKIDKYTYICSKHFKYGKPTDEFPDPLSACPYDNKEHTASRKTPKSRTSSFQPRKRRKLIHDEQTTQASAENEQSLCETNSTVSNSKNSQSGDNDCKVEVPSLVQSDAQEISHQASADLLAGTSVFEFTAEPLEGSFYLPNQTSNSSEIQMTKKEPVLLDIDSNTLQYVQEVVLSYTGIEIESIYAVS